MTGGVPHYRWPFYYALLNLGLELQVIAAGKLPPGIIADESADSRVGVTRLAVRSPRWRSDVVSALRIAQPDVILLEHGSVLDYSWTTLLTRAVAAPRVLWTHGIVPRELYGGERGPSAWARALQLRLATGIACYDRFMAGEISARFPRKIVGVAPNSTDGRPLVAARSALEREGMDVVRARLGLRSRWYLAGLGRLVPDKEFRRLLRVASLLRTQGIDVGIVLIGGGPEESALRADARALGLEDGLVFTGPVSSPSRLAEWLYAADLCVNPGFLGLSTVDCLFAGIPIASYLPSQSGPHHSPEWRYLIPGETGFFAKEHTDEALASVCAGYLASSGEMHVATRRKCASFAEAHLGVDKMADGMLDVIRRTVGAWRTSR